MRKLLILIIVLFTSNLVHAQWKGIARNDSTIWYSDVQFLNKDTGYIITPLGYLPSNSASTRLYRTKNGGNDWEFIDSFYQETYFHFFDYYHAIFQANFVINRGQKNAFGRRGLWFSKDCGKSLDSIPNTKDIGPPFFISNYTGFANNAGDNSFPLLKENSGDLYKTKDAGMHWNKVYSGYIQSRSMNFPTDTLTGYIQSYTNGLSMDSIILLKTTDAGEHWNSIYKRKYNWFNNGPDISEQFIFVTKDIILHSWDTAAFISRDGGKSWSPSFFPRPYGVSNFVFTDTTTLYGSSKGYFAKDSTGTGFYWGLSNYFDSLYYPKIYFLDKNFAYAYTTYRNASMLYVLNNAQKWNGVITAIKESIFHDEALEIFPNPASGWVNLKGYGFKPGKAELFCRDMLGRTVYNINMQAGNDGTFQCTIDISKLRQGMYQVEVWQGNFKQEKKLMVR